MQKKRELKVDDEEEEEENNNYRQQAQIRANRTLKDGMCVCVCVCM